MHHSDIRFEDYLKRSAQLELNVFMSTQKARSRAVIFSINQLKKNTA